MMTPGIRPGESPPFHEMDEYTFQNLCRDLFDTEPNIVNCEVYGVRRQLQDGIDLLAHREFGDGLEVGQCKCYKNISASQIKQASDEFFKYWDRWSKENIKRFILFVACDLSRRQQQDEILTQRKRFESFGIAYEVWSAAKIRNKLRPHPGIVASNFSNPDHWVKEICGLSLTLSAMVEKDTQSVVIVEAALINQNKELAKQISENTEQQLKNMSIAWHDGRKDRAIKWVKDLKSDGTQWQVLPRETKAKVLLFEASLELDETEDLSQVKKLADEARKLAPSIDQARLRALIALKENDPKTALELLADHGDIDSLNLRAAILLELGRVDECQAILNFEDNGLRGDGKT